VKRKAILLAKKTLVVSVPTKWVKKYGIQKGQEIDVQEQGPSLILQSGNHIHTPETLDMNHEVVGKLIHRTLSKAYEQGIDEINLRFKDISILAPLKISLQRLIGYEIIKQGKEYCIIKDISGQNYDSFDNSLTRLFLTVNNIMEDGIEAIKTNNKEILSSLITRDEDVNKFAHFCLRILAKKGHPEIHKQSILFFVITTLERTGDEFRDLLREIEKGKQLSKKEITAIQDIQKLLYHCYKLTLKPKIETAFAVAYAFDSLQERLQQGEMTHYIKTLTSLVVSIQEAQLGLIQDL